MTIDDVIDGKAYRTKTGVKLKSDGRLTAGKNNLAIGCEENKPFTKKYSA